MPQYNFVNVPQVALQAQAYKANAFNQGRREIAAQREDADYDLEQEYKKAAGLYGIARAMSEIEDDNEFIIAGQELLPYAIERGWIDGSKIDITQAPTREGIGNLLQQSQAIVDALKPQLGMGDSSQRYGAPVEGVDPKTGEPMFYQWSQSGDMRATGVRPYDRPRGMQLVDIPLNDGRTMKGYFDPEGRGFYDMQGNPVPGSVINRSGQPGGGQPGGGQQGGGQPAAVGITRSPEEQAAATEAAKLEAKRAFEVSTNESENLIGIEMYINESDQALRNIDRALEVTNWWSTGTMSQLLSGIGGTDAQALKARLEPILATLAFDRLQQMRDASKTGGALGQVSERELALLQGALVSLNQAQRAEDVAYALNNVRGHWTNVRRLTQARKLVQSGMPFAQSPDDVKKMIGAGELNPGDRFVDGSGYVRIIPNAK